MYRKVREIKVILNGKEKVGLYVPYPNILRKERKSKNRIYKWKEGYLGIYIPKRYLNKEFIVIPVEKGEITT